MNGSVKAARLDCGVDRQIHTRRVCVHVGVFGEGSPQSVRGKILSNLCCVCQGAGVPKEDACWDWRQGEDTHVWP